MSGSGLSQQNIYDVNILKLSWTIEQDQKKISNDDREG